MRYFQFLILILSSQCLTGCLSPLALDDMSQSYNEVTADDISKQLLLNIARAKHNEPIHFTGISNIAATMNFQANLGATPALTGLNGSTLMPVFGVGASENPTISIVPMQGEEFTKRMLTPITEDKLALLLRQNVDVDLLLRLAVLEYRSRENGHEEIHHNRPRNQEDYSLFRRIALHLSSIQDRDALYFEPLRLTQHWTLPAKNMSAKGFQELEKTYTITFDRRQDAYRLEKISSGRFIMSNYDPSQLPESERQKLDQETESYAVNDFLVDIRPGYTGGEFPFHGKLRLRSFSNILYFIGRALSSEPERDVPIDPRTPGAPENPQFTLAITETDSAPDNTDLAVKYKDKYYAVKADQDYPWNKSAFRVLSQIFQMTMSELPKTAVPSITIAK